MTLASTPDLIVTNSLILPLLGCAAVIYLIADAASFGDSLGVRWMVAATALLASMTPWWLRPSAATGRSPSGGRRASMLGVLVGIALAATLRSSQSLVNDASWIIATTAAATLLFDLAITSPDSVRVLSRLRTPVTSVAVGVAFAGLLSVLPPIPVAGGWFLMPARLATVPVYFAVALVCAALLVRLFRRGFGSAPQALAANAWGILALLPATLAILIAAALGLSDYQRDSLGISGVLSLAVAPLIYGHIALVDPARRVASGRALRRSAGVAVASFWAIVLGAVLVSVADEVTISVGIAVVLACVTLAFILESFARPVAHRVLAPNRGRLLDAVEEALLGLESAGSLSEAARATLVPLRNAAESSEAQPIVFTLDPGRQVYIDAAGEPHVSDRKLPQDLTEWLADKNDDVVLHYELDAHIVRKPELRRVIDTLNSYGAIAMVPLREGGELEGVLFLPRGTRQSALALEELSALMRLGKRLASLVTVVSRAERAHRRVAELSVGANENEEKLEELETELSKLKTEHSVLRAGRAAGRMAVSPIAYSQSMLRMQKRLDAIAPMEGPICLVAEGGSPVDRIGKQIHEQSPRGEGPFVIADCASKRPEDSMDLLFGTKESPGYLTLAAGGTLLLADLPAIGADAQHALAEALAVRQVRSIDGSAVEALSVRIIATTRVPLAALAETQGFDLELARWLTRLEVDVPPLRERKEDISSLVMLALDRSCRVMGRAPIGIEQPAMNALLSYDFPGNQRELQHVIDRAVAGCEGQQIGRADLPPLGSLLVEADESEPEDDSSIIRTGTYAEMEHQILQYALSRADGNKSEAARLLALKRSTFSDKLRRHHTSEDEESD